MTWIRSPPLPAGAGAGRRLRPRHGVPFRGHALVGQGAARPRRARVGRRHGPPPPDRHPEGGAQRQRRRRQDHHRPAPPLPPPRRRLHRPQAVAATEIDAAMAQMEPALQEKWAKIKRDLRRGREALPPRGRPDAGTSASTSSGGRCTRRSPSPCSSCSPSTCGTCSAAPGRSPARRSRSPPASECADCHGEIFDEWASVDHEPRRRPRTINEAPAAGHAAPRTARSSRSSTSSDSRSALLTGRDLDEDRRRTSSRTTPRSASTATRRSAARFTEDPFALLPVRRGRRRRVSTAAATRSPSDGVGCIVCHTQEAAAGRARRGVGRHDGRSTARRPAATSARCTGRCSRTRTRCRSASTTSRPEGDDEGFWRNDLETQPAVRRLPQRQGSTSTATARLGPRLRRSRRDDDDADRRRRRLHARRERARRSSDDDGDGDEDDRRPRPPDDLRRVAGLRRRPSTTTASTTHAETTFPNVCRSRSGAPAATCPTASEAEEPVVDQAPGLLPVARPRPASHTFVGVDYDLDPPSYEPHGLADDDIDRGGRRARGAARSAVPSRSRGDASTIRSPSTTAVIAADVLRHATTCSPTPSRPASPSPASSGSRCRPRTPTASEVCLLALIADAGIDGAVRVGHDHGDTDDILPQCDARPTSPTLGLGRRPRRCPTSTSTSPTADVPGSSECDPWLANFQKILTDGDPDGDGVRSPRCRTSRCCPTP